MSWVTGCRIILIITWISASSNGHLHEHTHQHVGDLFSLILKELKINQMYLHNIEKILSELHFTDCALTPPDKLTDCHKCLKAQDLFTIFEISTGSLVTESTFTKMAKFIVYFLKPEKNSGLVVTRNVCTENFNRFVPSSLNTGNFSSNGVYVTEKDLTKVLNLIEDDRHFTNISGCFSSHDIIHQIGIAHEDVYGSLVLTEEQFDKACLAVILNILQHKCIIASNPHHERLPPREFFINFLYSKFGHDGHISLEQLEKLLTDLGLGHHEENLHEDLHKHRRSISENLPKQEFRHRISRSIEDEDFNHTCYSTEQLLDIYAVNHGEGVKMSQFRDICPAVIQQLYTGVCKEQEPKTEQFDYTIGQVWGYGLMAVTVISLLSIIGISVIPVMRKSVYKKILTFLVAFAVGTLAGDGIMHLLPHALKIHQHGDEVSSEAWDWFWKLIVVVGGVYGFYLFETIMHFVIERKQKVHIEHTRSHNTDVGSTCRMMESHEMKSSTISQMYENLQDSCHKHHRHHHHNNHEVSLSFLPDVDSDKEYINNDDVKSNSKPKHDSQRDHKQTDKHDEGQCGDDKHAGHSHQDEHSKDKHVGHSHEHHHGHGHGDHAGHSHQPQRKGKKHAGHGHQHDHGGKNHAGCSHQHDSSHKEETHDDCQSETCGSMCCEGENARIDSYGALLEFAKPSKWDCSFDFSNVSSMAWTVIIGDTLHNISDGLAIGTAFADMTTNGPSIGISTALAVFCHELPHELGDFAVLLQAGMSVKMAILFNFLSACSCYIGLIIGILIGQDSDVRYWIFAVTAGMFIYVALVDMLPELMHSDELHSEPLATFLLQNLGIISGFCLMILMARYEEKIAISF